MIKRLLLSAVAVICVVSSGTALFADAPEKLMIYDGQNLKAQIYGFIKLDLVNNTSNVFNESSPFWVNNNAADGATNDETRGSFLIDARSTRLGLKITGPEVLGASTSLLIEGDFWGQMPNSGSASRQSMFRMRHAMAKFNWDFGAYLMVGQYWTMMMPLKTLPHTVAFIPLASSGLLFMREQQIALGQTVGPDMFNVTIEGAIARPQGGGDPGTGDYAGSRDTQIDSTGNGEASEMPAYRARISATFAPNDMINVHFGGAYAYHEERIELFWSDAGTSTALGVSEMQKSYCMLAFAKIQVWMFALTGHYYTGQNLDTFFAGMLQGVYLKKGATSARADSTSFGVPAHGGFGELSIDLRKLEVPAMINLGYGVDALRMRSWMETTSPSRIWNSTMYGNIWVFLHPNYRLGFEVALMETNHGGTEDHSTNQRYQLSFQFVF